MKDKVINFLDYYYPWEGRKKSCSHTSEGLTQTVITYAIACLFILKDICNAVIPFLKIIMAFKTF